jgi:hypothetical protein
MMRKTRKARRSRWASYTKPQPLSSHLLGLQTLTSAASLPSLENCRPSQSRTFQPSRRHPIRVLLSPPNTIHISKTGSAAETGLAFTGVAPGSKNSLLHGRRDTMELQSTGASSNRCSKMAKAGRLGRAAVSLLQHCLYFRDGSSRCT